MPDVDAIPASEALLRQDEALRREADALLHGRGLAALLAEYGTVHVAGSYAARLMTWRDLDLYLEAPGLPVERFLDLGRRLGPLLRPVRMTFNDHRQAPADGTLVGLYWGLRLGDLARGGWKLDLWAFEPEVCRERLAHAQRTFGRVTPETRLAILALKTALWDHPGYRKSITSQTVYDAVLDHGVRDLDGFWRHVAAAGAGSPG